MTALTESVRERLHEVCVFLHSNPELGLNEVLAHDTLCGFLETHGFQVERGYLGVATAFRAAFPPFGAAGEELSVPTVAVLAEYDALPGLGHACGHNLIATAALAAGLVAKHALSTAATAGGRVVVLGTPGEESGGGKCRLLEAGAFRHISAAMMVHPVAEPATPPVVYATTLAISELQVVFHGKAAHASGAPWEGINALDALVCFYNSVSVLRQQIKPECRVHGIIVDGGRAPNIIPERAEGLFYVRAPSLADLVSLKQRVSACASAAALATGCTLEMKWPPYSDYLDVRTNPTLAALFTRLWTQAAPRVRLPPEAEQRAVTLGSTDMGNVSYAVPSIHPLFPIPCADGLHTSAFAAVAATQEAFDRAVAMGEVMGAAVVELLANTALLAEARACADYTGLDPLAGAR